MTTASRPARTRGIRRLLPLSIAPLVALVTSCSTTTQNVPAEHELVVRTGPTALGQAGLLAGTAIGAAFLVFFLVVAVGILGSEVVDAVRSGQGVRAVAWALLLPAIAGFVGLAAWALGANTVFKHQSVVATASGTRAELTVERRRLLGDDSVSSWRYADIAEIEYEYVPASGAGEDYRPPQGLVFVRSSSGTQSAVFDGSPCPARELAEAVASATNARIRVRSGGRDIASIGSFLAQLRCGIEHPFRPTSWRQYPTEAWRVLDLPFLWRWPWTLPIVAGQLTLVAGALVAVARWRGAAWPTPVMLVAVASALLGVVLMHLFAVRSYGSWPAALALIALLSGRFVGRRLLPR